MQFTTCIYFNREDGWARQAMADATTKPALPDLPSLLPPWDSSQAPAVCEKTFPASFVPQPVENNTYLERDNKLDKINC